MAKGREDFAESASGNGNSDFGHSRGLSLKPDIPFSNLDVKGLALTHIIHTTEIANAKPPGGPGGLALAISFVWMMWVRSSPFTSRFENGMSG